MIDADWRGTWSVQARSGDRRCQLDLDVVRVTEREHVNAKRGESLDLAVRYASPVEDLGGLLELFTAVHAKAEVVEPNPILVETIILRGHRPQAHQQVAACHDDATPEDLVHGFCGRVARRR